jgi:7-carboxy-7-deazaguanine synthase
MIETALPVMEHFYTLQGEGYHTGRPAYFVRLGGCDVGCHWCDVKESWPIEGHQMLSPKHILELIAPFKVEIVVVTGGEPLMHNLEELTQTLKNAGYQTHIETSGAHALSGTWDWITLSPKKFKEPLEQFFEVSHELKCIAYNNADFDYAKQNAAKLKNANTRLYLQPEWSRMEAIMPQVLAFVKADPNWTLSLQTHKFINIP